MKVCFADKYEYHSRSFVVCVPRPLCLLFPSEFQNFDKRFFYSSTLRHYSIPHVSQAATSWSRRTWRAAARWSGTRRTGELWLVHTGSRDLMITSHWSAACGTRARGWTSPCTGTPGTWSLTTRCRHVTGVWRGLDWRRHLLYVHMLLLHCCAS